VQLGLAISVMLHAALLCWAIFAIQSQRELRTPEPEAIVTGLVSESDLTRLKLGVRTAREREAKAKQTPKPDVAKKKDTARPKPVAAAPPPPPPPAPPADAIADKLAAATPPPPAPAPPAPAAEEQRKLDAMLKEQALQAEAQRKAEEQRRLDEQRRQAAQKKKADDERRAREAAARKKREELRKRREAALKRKQEEDRKRREMEAKAKQKFDPAAIERQLALLDRDPRKKNAPAAVPPPQTDTKAEGPTLGAKEGRDQQISASELAMLRARISARLKGCWRLPSGGGGSDTPVVTLRWRMRPDGSLDGDPEVEQPRSDALFRIAAEAAQRAVRECAPFDLPADQYRTWRVITWEFDPSQMM
jgi:colicin import membrane protein